MDDTTIITVNDTQAGTRLDKFLADHLPDVSRSRLKALIKGGAVSVLTGDTQETINNPSRSVKSNDRYCINVPEPESAEPEAEDIPLDVVYEDDHLIVVNKSAGMVVHPASGSPNGTLVNALLHHCKGSLSGIGGVIRPGIVHRIDKDTSGLLVVAKDDKTHNGLAEQFADHSIERVYTALVRGQPNPLKGRVEGNIARHPKDRKRMAVVDAPHGKHAVTHYETMETFRSGGIVAASRIECRLETGRTHQVRVHMTHKNCPLIGDSTYGHANRMPSQVSTKVRGIVKNFPRQALHARDLGFIHPITGETLKFTAEFPHDIKGLLSGLQDACQQAEI